MSRTPCKCCEGNRPITGRTTDGWGYNRINGEAGEWARNNRFFRSEHCVHVKDGKRFGGEQWQKDKCGDGTMGFSTRRRGQDEVHLETGLDGQTKKRRHTLINPRSARAAAGRRSRRVDGSKCGLVSSVMIKESQRDPIVVAKQRLEGKRAKRASNRNNKARRGHERARRMAA